MNLPALDMLPQITDLPCNRCGECCRHSNHCQLRVSHADLPEKFDGVCDLLMDNGECEAMVCMGEDALTKLGIDGICDWGQYRVVAISKHLDAVAKAADGMDLECQKALLDAAISVGINKYDVAYMFSWHDVAAAITEAEMTICH